MNASFQLFPLLPLFYDALMAAVTLLVVWAAWRRRLPDYYCRAAFFVLLLLILLNPVVLHEVREGLPDKLVVVLDESASQKIGGRDVIAEKALQSIEEKLKAFPGVEPVIVRVPSEAAGTRGESTNLFGALRGRLTDFPLTQVAGTILITDGQVHDAPDDLGVLEKLRPYHVVLTGRKDEFDRKVTIVSAPKYSVLNDDIRIAVKVEEFGRGSGAPVVLTSYQDGQISQEQAVAPGEVVEIPFRLAHPGQNVFEFKAAVAEGELTPHNNTAPVIINGIRDRLRVLLVSGAPHMGERAWRNLLKSDPAIDLVHFTILRSPNVMDMTPQRELSLIVFPVDELFEQKINDFDLIIFDRYQQYGLLLPEYFNNIANFVRNGGALLMAMGTDRFDGVLFSTPLGDIVPMRPGPQTEVLKGAFRPALTETGKVHPVTADIMRPYAQKPWGEWYSEASIRATRGETLMTGTGGNPLLVLDKVEQGRVAVLSSDNIWLWSKTAAGGGPYTELLRNISHWLMKEPELEEDFIKAEARGSAITVSMHDIGPEKKDVVMTAPSGKESALTLNIKDGGWARATVAAEENGIYSFVKGDKKAFAVVGTALNAEFADVHTTPDLLAPAVRATRGGTIWFQDTPGFDVRAVSSSAGTMGGDDWLGLRRNEAYAVSSVDSAALVPDSLALLLLLAGLMAVWWREGGRKNK